MSKIKGIKKEDVAIILADLERLMKYIETEQQPRASVRYTKGTLTILIKQLQGELPII